MTQKTYILVAAMIALLLSCTSNKYQITDSKDYQAFLEATENPSIAFAESERDFWKNKYTTAPNQASYLVRLAQAHTLLFEGNGTIEDLKVSEKCLLEANQKVAYKNSGLLRVLAKNYISQHRFKEALRLLEQAYVLGEKKKATQKMLFDVYLELGDDLNAKKHLQAIKNFNDFDYLIRLSKWKDHRGDLIGAIRIMEQGKAKAEALKNKELILWSYSNLADFYGHNGQIEASYEHYLKALSIDPNYTYALQGIAWILFSHEKNVEEASKIIDVIVVKHNTPDLILFKAELAEYSNNHKEKERHLQHYFEITKNKAYGDMYNSYNTLLYADQLDELSIALNIAKKEIENRPRPESYDLLAWVYYKKGEPKMALEIIQVHVAGKSYVPTILYHTAEIYKANDMKKELASIKKELINSLYELGPNMIDNIYNL